MRSTLPDAPVVGLKLTPDTVHLFPARLSAGQSADYHKRQAAEELQGGKHDWSRSILWHVLQGFCKIEQLLDFFLDIRCVRDDNVTVTQHNISFAHGCIRLSSSST